MIKGTKYWNDPSKKYSQENNAIENLLSTFTGKNQLETCGPTACVNALATTGHNVDITMRGGASLQPEDVLTIWLNDPLNEGVLQEARGDIDPKDYMDNRVPQYLPVAIQAVFRVESTFSWGCDFDMTKKSVSNGQACVVLLKSPGHYITIKAYDNKTNELIYDDPWSNNYWPARSKGSSPFNRRLKETDFENIDNFKITVYP